MKGIILAGGKGTRLYPCTQVVNKHLLPIYDKPMIFYPIETLVRAGCQDLLIISGEALGDLAQLIGDGHRLGIRSVMYAYQETAGGIADALRLAKCFVGQEKFCVILGDNLILDDLSPYLTQFETEPENTCKLFIKVIANPTAFGVAEILDQRIVNIIEKPEIPPSNYAVIGVYLYDHHVFEVIQKLKPSARGELEITDVNRHYVNLGHVSHAILSSTWLDAGTFKTLLEASTIMSRLTEMGK